MKLSELAHRIGACLADDGSGDITAVATLEDAQPGQVSFLSNPRYIKQLETTRASAVIVGNEIRSDHVPLLKMADPYYGFLLAMEALHGHRAHPHEGIHPRAHVDATARVGENSILYPGVYVGPRARIGQDCILYPNVVVYDDCILGDRVIIHACSVIGQDGFGHVTHEQKHFKIPQVGNVIIEDDVEIGANNSIDRAALGSTVIGRGTRMGNGNTIGHGSRIGAYALLAGQVGVAGSVSIGHHATVAGQVGIAGHLKIGDHVSLGAQTGVMHDLEDGSTCMGTFPAMPQMQARRVMALVRQLPELLERLRKLEKGDSMTNGQ